VFRPFLLFCFFFKFFNLKFSGGDTEFRPTFFRSAKKVGRNSVLPVFGGRKTKRIAQQTKTKKKKKFTKTTQTKKLSLPRGSLEFPSLKRSRARS